MAQINLLPKDLAPKPSVVKASGAVKKLTTVGVILLIVSLVSSIGLFMVFSKQLKQSSLRKAELEESIKALQATEQRLVLIKDRLSLINEVVGRESAADELTAIFSLINNLPDRVSINQAKLEKSSTSASFQAQDSLALAQMLSTVVALGAYQQVDLLSISYSPTAGFSANFKLEQQ